jgi:hypothetical protein
MDMAARGERAVAWSFAITAVVVRSFVITAGRSFAITAVPRVSASRVVAMSSRAGSCACTADR